MIVVFGGCDAQIRLVSLKNGKKIADIDTGSYIAASVAIEADYAYVGNYANKLLCIDLFGREIEWEYGDEYEGAPFFSSPAIGKDRILIGSRDYSLHCIEKKSGKKIWTFMTGGDVDSSPVICGEKVVFGSSDGRVYIVNLRDGKEIWSYEIGAGVTGSPAVAGGMVVIGADDGLIYAFGG
jgi:outer membrane protein assembly factor BamB